jgi:hypothetical protein
MNRNDDSSWQLFLAIACWGASLVILFLYSPFAWVMKDGLGPDALESQGLLALGRFWKVMRWTFGLVVVPMHLAGWLFYWCDRRRNVDPPAWIELTERNSF